AVEAVIWGMPAVNTDLMRQEMFRKTDGTENQILYWSRPADANNQTLTPNTDCISFMTFYNTKEAGPVVIEPPPADKGAFAGSIMTFWQMPMADVGPDGEDKGKGGKYLVLPPGHKEEVPEGYIVLPSDTYAGYALLRSNLISHSDADIAKANDYGKRTKVYPLSSATSPPPTKFSDASPVLFDSTIRYDVSFFENLNRVVQDEPSIDRDRAMIDQLMSIGIEKGKPFNPDAKTKAILTDAISEVHALLEARYDAGMPEFNPGIHWTLPAMPDLIASYGTSYGDPNAYPVDSRGLPRRGLHLCVRRHPQTRCRAVLPHFDQRQGRPELRGKQALPPTRAGQCTGETILVGHCLRPADSYGDQRHAVREPFLADPG